MYKLSKAVPTPLTFCVRISIIYLLAITRAENENFLSRNHFIHAHYNLSVFNIHFTQITSLKESV